MPVRRFALPHACFAVMSALMVCAPAAAADQAAFPTKALTVVVPFPPGGINDTVARPALKKMGDVLGTSIVVENRPGASGTIGTAAVARAPADGYTLLLGAASTMAVVPHMIKQVPYDPIADFTPVGGLASVPSVLVTSRTDVFADYAAVLAAAKKQPGKLTFGSAGPGTSHHVQMTFLNMRSGVDMLHVPYKGSGPAMADLLGGQIDFLMDPVPTTLAQVGSGRLKPLGITSAERSPLLPDVPTFTELGVKDFVVSTWFGLFAPAGTPPDVVARLTGALKQALADPAIAQTMAASGLSPMYKDPGAMAQYVKDENILWKNVIEESGIGID